MLYLEIPGLPPSSNHAYWTRGKVRGLTAAGKKYKLETKDYLTKKYFRELRDFKPDEPLAVLAQFQGEIHNKYPGRLNPKTKKPTPLYKKSDGSNLWKLFADALADVTGVDDSCFLATAIDEIKGPPFTRVAIWWPERELSPLNELAIRTFGG